MMICIFYTAVQITRIPFATTRSIPSTILDFVFIKISSTQWLKNTQLTDSSSSPSFYYMVTVWSSSPDTTVSRRHKSWLNQIHKVNLFAFDAFVLPVVIRNTCNLLSQISRLIINLKRYTLFEIGCTIVRIKTKGKNLSVVGPRPIGLYD